MNKNITMKPAEQIFGATSLHDKELVIWRAARPALRSNHRIYFTNIIEELLEPLYTKERVKEFTKEIVDKYYAEGIEPASDNCILDSICDIQVFSINEVELMGYDNNKCMDETVEEISSRQQDPAQKELWYLNGSNGEKWMKDPIQDPSTLYTADYGKCKR